MDKWNLMNLLDDLGTDVLAEAETIEMLNTASLHNCLGTNIYENAVNNTYKRLFIISKKLLAISNKLNEELKRERAEKNEYVGVGK